MKKNTKAAQPKNMHLAFYFGFVVFFIILISFGFKVFTILMNSKFDGDNRFTVAVVMKSKTDFISISPKEKKLTLLSVKDVGGNMLSDLRVPYDSYMVLKQDHEESAKSYFSKLIFSSNRDKTNLTIYDLIRLSMLAKGLDKSDILEKTISYKDISGYNSIIADNFIDKKLEEENVSIEVINSASAPGLGNQVANTISNLGGNVVLVTTSKDISENSKIIIRKNTYTAEKLSRILNIKIELNKENSLSDVIIVLGKDRLEE